MRQTILITTCAFALLLFFVPLSGQNTFTVVYDTVNWISPPQAGPQDTINYTLRVSHNLPGDYAGPIDIMARVGGGTPFMLFSSLQDSIPPGPGGKLYSIRDTVDLARYGGGINIVVVWPTAPNFVTLDSAHGELTVINVSTPDPEQYAMDVYPNPSTGTIRFRTKFPTVWVHETTLIDQQGRLLRRESGLPRQMSLDDLPAGVYFLNMRLKDGQALRYKVLRGR
jgi:hypothetical protein